MIWYDDLAQAKLNSVVLINQQHFEMHFHFPSEAPSCYLGVFLSCSSLHMLLSTPASWAACVTSVISGRPKDFPLIYGEYRSLQRESHKALTLFFFFPPKKKWEVGLKKRNGGSRHQVLDNWQQAGQDKRGVFEKGCYHLNLMHDFNGDRKVK